MFPRAILLASAILASSFSTAAVTDYGKGSIADAINPDSYECVEDYGFWIFNAGVVEPGIAGCVNGEPVGQPTPLFPQLSAPAVDNVTAAHRWWGSVAFNGERQTGNPNHAGHITPDPITARVTEKGVRMMSIPGGLKAIDATNVGVLIPDPFAEVFDGLAVGNTDFGQMDATMKDYSDGSVTVQWSAQEQAVMEATFVHGSPYVYFSVAQGDLVLRSKAPTSGEKGVFHQQGNSLGIWTDVAGNRASFLVVGDGNTSYANIDSNEIVVASANNRMTVALLPVTGATIPSAQMIADFEQFALNPVAKVNIDYAVNRTTNDVTVTHQYLDASGTPTTSLVGMLPMHWKNSAQATTAYQTRSARGVTKYATTDSFSYTIPFLGVLPYLPAGFGEYDNATLEALVDEFIALGEDKWDENFSDTYWSPKTYAKVAELQAIARSHGLQAQADTLLAFLKAEMQDWFTAKTGDVLDTSKYFYYDPEWNTLLGFGESFGAQQQLNDHHFHYGYFVRVAAEICRVERSWCSSSEYGPMVELLIRDYAAGRDDDMFPYLRHFDPANGFSWASGHANFVRGNNNESTSEAANAYGAMVLYGMITDNQELTERGMYLHAATMESFWQYWNNIDRYLGKPAEYDNFPSNFSQITTSIIWGDGHVFSTWFSGAYAHILGIQGLPLNPLVMHLGLYPEYLADYVQIGLSQSSNNKPSGLVPDQWRDVWWNIWAMTDADAAIADHASMNFDYIPELGETKAHTYHWIHTMQGLGHLYSGRGNVTANDPGTLVFNKNGLKTYLAYNFSTEPKQISFSDGTVLDVAGNAFGMKQYGDDTGGGDTRAPSTPANLTVDSQNNGDITLAWEPSSDNVGVTGYRLYQDGVFTTEVATASAEVSLAEGSYQFAVSAVDAAGNESAQSESVTVFVDGDDTPVGFSFDGTLPNGLIDGEPVAYNTTASFDAATGEVTIKFNSEIELSQVWLYNPGFNDATQLSPTRYSVTLSGYSEGQQLTWYFLALKNGQQADNVTASHTWTVSATAGPEPDTIAPTVPNGLLIESQDQGNVVVSWLESSDNVAVTGYRLYQNDQPILTTSDTSAALTLSVGSYALRVSAFDAADNESELSDAITVTVEPGDNSDVFTFSGTLPNGLINGAPVGYDATASFDEASGSVTIVFDANVPLTEVWVFTPGFNNATAVSATQFILTLTGYSEGDSISWYFLARGGDQQADNSTAPHDWIVTASDVVDPEPDTEAPSQPQNLVLVSKADRNVTLAWDASTDNVAVTEYLVLQNGVVVATTTDTTITFENLAIGRYKYIVQAMDAAGNVSQQSDLLKVKIPINKKFRFEGTLPNGLIDGEPLTYTAIGKYDKATGTVTIKFKSAKPLTEVWLFNPGFNDMTKLNKKKYELQISDVEPGQTLTWYFLAKKGDQQADNSTASHSWTL